MRDKGLRSIMILLVLVASTLLLVPYGYPQDADISKYPSRPITFISPLPPGASADLSCRLIAKEAEKFLKRPVVLLNKPGATHAVGAAAIASAKPDGYTVGYTSTTPLVITPFLEKLPYDPLKEDVDLILSQERSCHGIFQGSEGTDYCTGDKR